jgi:hypothetical protein
LCGIWFLCPTYLIFGVSSGTAKFVGDAYVGHAYVQENNVTEMAQNERESER